jgi:hypothetical protein
MEATTIEEWGMLPGAKHVAERILSGAGVRLKWLRCCNKFIAAEPAVTIAFSSDTPSLLEPGALGSANPYAPCGTRITVFIDRLRPRLRSAKSPIAQGAVLGHVIAHEVTHALQGIARHSDRGLMKARWSEDDFWRMDRNPLEYTPVDLTLIRNGLARCSKLASNGVAP